MNSVASENASPDRGPPSTANTRFPSAAPPRPCRGVGPSGSRRQRLVRGSNSSNSEICARALPPGAGPTTAPPRPWRRAASAGRGLRQSLLGVVARADQRPRRHGLEPHRVRLALEPGELLRVPVAHDRQVVLGRPQVLADGQDLHAVLAQHAEGLEQLLLRLPEPGHQARFGDDLVAAHLLRVPEYPARAEEARPAPRERVQPRHGLHVVVEDVRPLGDHARERHLLAAEVRGEHLDLAAGRHATDRADHADERARAEVGQVVAVHARDHGVAEPHLLDRLRHAERLERVVVGGLARLDVAEAAAARAGVAEDHERGGAALPALADVRARRLLADRVKPLALDHPAQLAVHGAAGRRPLEPLRLPLTERAHLAHELEHPRAARVGARARAHAATGSRPSTRRGETIRCLIPNASANRHASRLRKHGSEGCRPVSLDTEVMRAWSIPQGTIQSNGWRSLSTFTARPCVETRADSRTPMEPIFESPTHTPVNGVSRGSAAMPSSARAATIARSIVWTKSATRSTAMIGYATSWPVPW